jgi:L-asparaginase II
LTTRYFAAGTLDSVLYRRVNLILDCPVTAPTASHKNSCKLYKGVLCTCQDTDLQAQIYIFYTFGPISNGR